MMDLILRNRPNVRRVATVLALLCTLPLFSGCSGKKMRDGFVDVRGTVTLDGDPLPNAQVTIETTNGSSFARTDRNGNYIAEYSRSLKGAGVGDATVRISTREIFPDEDVSGLEVDPRSGDHIKPELVPVKYNKKSELKITIENGGGPYNFELESDRTGSSSAGK